MVGTSRVHVDQTAVLLFVVVLISLLLTMAPTIYTLDSSEFALGAKTLGVVHAPGYPLYLSIAHLFTYLPIGDIAYRVNLLSALSLAATAPVLYALLRALQYTRWAAVTSVLMFVWSYYGWVNGIIAEVYAPQLLTLSVTGLALVRLHQRVDNHEPHGVPALVVGLAYGVAVAMAPSSILFCGGLVAAFLALRIAPKLAVSAGLLALLVFALSLTYFPLRADADLAINMAGTYGPAGDFRPYDLRSPAGIWNVLRGEQFASLFFAEGYLPSLNRLADVLGWFTRNYMGVGVVFGVVGLHRQSWRLVLLWLSFTLPYAVFFLSYGADDVDLMLSPLYLCWTVPLAHGLQWTLGQRAPRVITATCLGLVAMFAVVNYPLVNSRDDTHVYDRAQATLSSLPQDSIVFGQWLDVVPLQYVQAVDNQRPDVTIYNLGLFEPAPYFPHFDETWRPVFVLDQRSVDVYVNQSRYDVVERAVAGQVIYELRR